MKNSRIWCAFTLLVFACDVEPAAPPDAGIFGDDCDEVVCDEDGDGFEIAGGCCATGLTPFDCDDDDATVNPDVSEICGDDIDNDCNGFADEESVCFDCEPECVTGDAQCSGPYRISYCDNSSGCPLYASPVDCPENHACREGACLEVCVDRDGDGFLLDCTDQRDCDDSRSDVFPGNDELCDDVDNNCDTRIDENFVCDQDCVDECDRGESGCTGDGRGFVNCAMASNGCTYWTGVILCEDDAFCSGGVCQAEPVCTDLDGDLYGPACGAGFEDDCRPSDSFIYPGAAEVCDGLDNDCDGQVDEGGACNTCIQATVAAPLDTGWGSPVYRVSCSAVEYVSVGSIENGSRASIIVSSQTTLNSVSVGRLEGSSFVEITEGFQLGDDWVVVWEAGESLDDVLLAVGSTIGTPYRLATTLAEPGFVCSDDAYEPNNAPAAGVPLGDLPFVAAGTICGHDFDFFALDLSDSVVSVSLAHGVGERLMVSLWRNGIEVGPSFAGPVDDTGFFSTHYTFFRVDTPGQYEVGVRGQSVDSADYALAIGSTTVPCTDSDMGSDGFEDDSFATARSVSSGVTVSGVICPGDFDIIEVGPLSGGQLTATLTHSISEGNLDARMLHDNWDGLTQEARSDTDNEFLDSAISTAGTYYFAIYGRTAGDSASYVFSYSR